jgi:hypothetical protein
MATGFGISFIRMPPVQSVLGQFSDLGSQTIVSKSFSALASKSERVSGKTPEIKALAAR